MATGTAPPPLEQELPQADQLIDRQLSRVRQHIRITDLVSSSMLLVGGVLLFFLAAAVIDHWIVGLGTLGRWLALVAVIAGSVWYTATRILPSLIRPINPAFAAQQIERSEPALKNSLLNYLLLRSERSVLHRVVYDALRQRAATDVAQVEVDQTVDRTSIIRAGYLLVAIMAIAAAYQILSPKDPLQSVHRILAPWTDIARPARVSIEDVQPGDSELFQGQSAQISAIVRGAGSGEEVWLIYSTDDGQTVDRRIPMQLDSAGLRHTASLPPEGGLRQSVHYRLAAADGITRDFHLQVVAAPAMEVVGVEYDYPAYTRRSRDVVQNEGDVRGLEGTRVTIRARANQPIKSATLALRPAEIPSDSTTPATTTATAGTESLLMEFQGMEASRSFFLELANDRQRPKFSSYTVSFVNTAGRSSASPVIHRIEVTPDLAPEIEFLTPQRDRVEVPLSGKQKIEIRAIDPDFGLRQVRWQAVRANEQLVDKSLLPPGTEQSGQLIESWEFRPRDYNLNVGDRVSYWATAEDNRTEMGGEGPWPNATHTPHYQLIVVDDPPGRPGSDKPAPVDSSEERPADSPENQRSVPFDSTKPSQEKPPPEQPGKKPGEEQPGEKAKSSPSQDAGQQKGQPQSGEKSPESGEPSEQGGTGGTSQASEEPSGEKQSSSSGEGGKSGSSSASQPPGSGNETSSGNEGSDRNPTGQPGQTGSSKGGKPGDPRGGDDSSGQRSEPLHDGDVFEKALNRLREKQQPTTGKDGQGSGAEQQSSDAGQENPGAGSENTPSEKGPPSTDTKQGGAKDDRPGQEQPSSPPEKGPSDSAKKPSPQDSGSEAQHPDQNQGEGAPRDGAPGEGGKSARGGKEQPEEGTAKPSTDGKKQPGMGDNGQSGAGQNSKDPTGSGSTEEVQGEKVENRDRPKTMSPDGQEPQEKDDPSNTTSEHQSDSQGEQSGDRSGGGKKGPGQGAKQPGNDSAGSSSSSDDGAGQSKEPGQGDSSSSAGGQQKSDGPTGKSGNEKGSGSGSSSDPNGAQPGSPTDRTPHPMDDQPKGPSPGERAAGGGQQPGAGEPQGGGLPADRPTGTPPPNANVPDGDAANLDYARRATDLVLDYLRDQKDKPDAELLDELGWTPEDMRAFLERWQTLKRGATEGGDSQRELDESLRSLGLRPPSDSKRQGVTRSDDLRGLRESSGQSSPPATYRDQYKAFKKGTASGPK